MSENYAVQISIKIPHDADNYRDTLVNLRAEQPQQLEQLLSWVQGHAAEIGSAVQTVRAAGGVGTAFAGAGTVTVQQEQPQQGSWPQSTMQQTVPQPQAPAPQQAAGPQGPGASCVHGPMVYRTGTGKKGPWRAYFCPTPKGTPDQCAAQFL